MALQAAQGVSGVLGADPGPSRLRVTADPTSGVLVGVSVTAMPDGRYGVDLSLVAEMVSLPELADEVRARVLEGARRARVARLLGSINVEFAYVMTREELAAAAASAQEEAETLITEESGAAEAEVARPKAAGAARTEAPEAVAAPGPTATPAAGRSADAGGEASSAGGAASSDDAMAATIAARQAAIATDQAALAAKQAALAAEQAALAAGSGVIGSPAASAPSTEPDAEEEGA